MYTPRTKCITRLTEISAAYFNMPLPESFAFPPRSFFISTSHFHIHPHSFPCILRLTSFRLRFFIDTCRIVLYARGRIEKNRTRQNKKGQYNISQQRPTQQNIMHKKSRDTISNISAWRGGYLLSHINMQYHRRKVSLTSLFGMGRGGTSPL